MVVDNRLLWCQLFISRFGQGQGRWNDPRSDGQTGCIYCLPSIFNSWELQGRTAANWYKMPHCHNVSISSHTLCEKKNCAQDIYRDQWNTINSGRTSGGKIEFEAYGTRYSQAVTHPSTNRALRCLTAVIGRELVCSTWYGRRQQGNLWCLRYL